MLWRFITEPGYGTWKEFLGLQEGIFWNMPIMWQSRFVFKVLWPQTDLLSL